MKILLVSDDDLFAHLTANKLEKWGHEVAVESTGTDALDRVRREPFRVVITGCDLQGLSGFELCRKIRALKQNRYTYIVFYTAKNDKESLMAGYEAGADDFLVRPFNAPELHVRLKAASRLLDLEDELRHGSGVDSETGLVNAASFRQFFRVILAEARRTESGGALMFVKLLNYRETLDRFGLGPAQRMAVEVAATLGRAIRDSDLVARLDDDAFCLALQNTFWERCVRVAEKISAQVENMALYIDDVTLRPAIEISIVNYPAGDLGVDETIDSAERVIYEAKAEAQCGVAG